MAFAKALELLRLARLASGSRGVRLTDIEHEFGCSRRTAQRMTDALQSLFPEADFYTDESGYRRWVVPRRSLTELLSPRPEELASLDFAISRLGNDNFENERRGLESLRATLLALTNERVQVRAEADSEALLESLGVAARPGPTPSRNHEVDAEISHALKGPFQLRILYRGRRDDVPAWRVIHPHGLLLGARRYLIATDASKTDDRLRHFRVEAIEDAQALDESAQLKEGFDLGAYTARAFGSFHDEREYCEVVWRFSATASDHARRFRFHPNQTLEDCDDGSLLVRFHASGYLEMAWHLYQWGDQVEVLKPSELRDMVQEWRRNDFAALP